MAKEKVKSSRQVIYLGEAYVDKVETMAVKLTAKFQRPVSRELANRYAIDFCNACFDKMVHNI